MSLHITTMETHLANRTIIIQITYVVIIIKGNLKLLSEQVTYEMLSGGDNLRKSILHLCNSCYYL